MPGSSRSGRGPDGKRPRPLILDVEAIDVTKPTPLSDAPVTDIPGTDAAVSDAKESEIKTPEESTPTEPLVTDEAKPEPSTAPPETLAEPASPPPPIAAKPRRGGAIAAAVLGLAAGIIGGLFGALLLSHFRGDEERAADAGRRLAAVESGQQNFANRRALDEASQQVKALEARLAKAETAANRPGADPELSRRVATLDESGKAANAALTEIRKRLDEMATVLTAARAASASPGEIASLAIRVAAAEQAAKSLEAALAAPSRDRDPAARLALAVMLLRPLVESGAPYSRELAALKALDVDATKIAPLEVFADAGLPATATLARDLSALTAPVRASAAPSPPATGLWDRFVAGLTRLVSVRPIDQPAKAATGDAVGRVRALAASGDLAQAASEAAKLPEPERRNLEPWIARVKQRVAALDAVRDLANDALSRIAAGAR